MKPLCLIFAAFLILYCEKKPSAGEPRIRTPDKETAVAAEKSATAQGQPRAAMPELLSPEDPDEACGQVIVVAWKGADHAGAGITRDRAQARARAQDLLQQAQQNPDFAALAREHSDAKSSGPRGGIIGAYRREKWPVVYESIREIVFSLKVNQIADAVAEASYGYIVFKRCPVEKARARHVLIRYREAKNATKEITRSREEAEKLAEEIYRKVKGKEAEFADVARLYSEDSSAKRGGDIGAAARGQLALPFEEALFSMSPGEIRGVVETEYGFHIIQRLKSE
ncbi:MAG: peptidylprolyl isomerase [Deltaproteobacteria bacterium]|nr:peptidylprolyl isomerase [Deltaproteobacteria bacterium]